jgi:uncharacterized protein (TIGR03435 family)
MGYAHAQGLAVFVVILASSTATAQSGSTPIQITSPAVKTPVYEVASVRENTNPNPRWNMSFTPDGVHATDVTLMWALHEAYGILDDELWSGGPGWINQKRFDIDAKFDITQYPNLTRQERMEMLQQLLADRFKLVVHHEAKEFPLYALVIAKDGPNVAETKPEDLRTNPVYGVMCTNKAGHRGHMEMSGCTLAQFAGNLSGYARNDLGRRVIDETGLTGHYTIALTWSPVDTNPASTEVSATDASGGSIFTAVKEQLGLELKPINGPLDTIVIDHVEMPSEN